MNKVTREVVGGALAVVAGAAWAQDITPNSDVRQER